jgi:putative transposase
MAYRTIEIDWMPQSHAQWATFGAARREAARLWGDLVKRHHRLRRLNWQWPSKARWQSWARGRYPGLSAQATQQIIGEFCEAVNATRQLRKNGHPEARYPWRTPRYRDVVYTNQDARVRDGWLILPNGRSRTLRIHLPQNRPLPGRLMEARLCLGRILLVCQVDDVPYPQQTVIGVDLGVNTLIAATDGEKVLLVSGREAKATVQWRNKKLASLGQRQARMTKGSRRWKRLQRRKAKMRGKARRRIADLVHKATRQVAAAFPGATCYVGAPFNDAAQDMAPRQAQTVSQACTARLIGQLDYKTCGAMQVSEAYTSQTCPRCGRRHTGRRTYRCTCGIVAPRDVVGATNILSVGRHGSIHPDTPLPTVVRYARPVHVFRRKPDSSPGHGGSSSA